MHDKTWTHFMDTTYILAYLDTFAKSEQGSNKGIKCVFKCSGWIPTGSAMEDHGKNGDHGKNYAILVSSSCIAQTS